MDKRGEEDKERRKRREKKTDSAFLMISLTMVTRELSIMATLSQRIRLSVVELVTRWA